jgi:N-acetylmuramoyl-L-alanine amidase
MKGDKMKKTVLIDPGHGGKDPGALNGAFVEKTLNLKAALALRDYLTPYDCEIIMTRTTDVFLSVEYRYNLAISKKADCSICMHHNAGGGDGGEVWFWHTDPKAKNLAALIAQEYKAIGQNLRTGSGMPEGTKASMKGGTNFGMCRVPASKGIPAILGEFAFVDNTTDRKIVDTDAELVAQGKAYGKAVVKFLGLKLKPVKPPVTPPAPTVKKYTLAYEATGHRTADDAKKRINSVLTLSKGEYYIYKEYNGMLNLTKVSDKPGSWVNPVKQVVTMPHTVSPPIVVPPTTPITPPTPTKPPDVVVTPPEPINTQNGLFLSLFKAIMKMLGK